MMNDVDKFYNKHMKYKYAFGWISPDGDFLFCEMYDHLEVLKDLPEVQQYYEECERNDAYIWEELSCLDDDEHPAMHRFDDINDDARHECLKSLYEAGWIRIGTNKKLLEAEGYSIGVDLHRKFFTEMSQMLNLKPFERKLREASHKGYRYFVKAK